MSLDDDNRRDEIELDDKVSGETMVIGGTVMILMKNMKKLTG